MSWEGVDSRFALGLDAVVDGDEDGENDEDVDKRTNHLTRTSTNQNQVPF